MAPCLMTTGSLLGLWARTKENGSDRDPMHPDPLSKRPCTLSPAQRYSPSNGLPHPTLPPHYRLEDMALAHHSRDSYRHPDPRELRERHRQLSEQCAGGTGGWGPMCLHVSGSTSVPVAGVGEGEGNLRATVYTCLSGKNAEEMGVEKGSECVAGPRAERGALPWLGCTRIHLRESHLFRTFMLGAASTSLLSGPRRALPSLGAGLWMCLSWGTGWTEAGTHRYGV